MPTKTIIAILIDSLHKKIGLILGSKKRGYHSLTILSALVNYTTKLMMKSGSKIQDTTNTFRHSSKLFSENHQSLILIQTDTPCYCGEKLFQKTICKIGITGIHQYLKLHY